MPTTIIGTVKTAAVNTVRTPGAVKRLLRPARPVATAVAGAARDTVRSRRELLAENALLRQQLIVLRRGVKRPAFGRADRLVMVLVARLSSAWREAVQVVQPDTLLRGIGTSSRSCGGGGPGRRASRGGWRRRPSTSSGRWRSPT